MTLSMARKPNEGSFLDEFAAVTQRRRLAFRAGEWRNARRKSDRAVALEVPVALTYGGTTHAVMMASPSDLEDFAVGFTLSEGIVSEAGEIETLRVERAEPGFDIQIHLAPRAERDFAARRRRFAGPVGCGLCGIESIGEVMRPARSLAGRDLRLGHDAITGAMALLFAEQVLHQATGAIHAAGFFVSGQCRDHADIAKPVAVREDVGRHNALDKLAGALARADVDGSTGFVVITSRVSVEMVQKTAAIGAPVLVAVSAPTALAVDTARACGMTLVAFAREDGFDVFTGAERINGNEEQSHGG